MKIEDYSVLAEVKNQDKIFYKEYGSYQGEWILITSDKDNLYLYKDWYGSCSGCDGLQAEDFEYFKDYSPKDKKVLNFFNNYHPYLTIEKYMAKQMISNQTFSFILPLNIDYDDKEIDIEEIIIAVKQYLNQ